MPPTPASPIPAGNEGTPAEAELRKAEGNQAYARKKYALAALHYTGAIELQPLNHLYYSNRALAHAAVGTFDSHVKALRDAERIVLLAPTFAKGWCRIAAACVETKVWERAEEALAEAAALCAADDALAAVRGDVSRLQRRLDERRKVAKVAERDFEDVKELGVGNYTRINLVRRKATGQEYALKLVNLEEMKRTNRRHPNIENEVTTTATTTTTTTITYQHPPH